jgi:glucose-1-phosphate cytidylyltransferase
MDNSNIPVVILCGGSGTRLREMTEFLPKPMIPIGGKPMLVHIMKWYAKFGFNRFILALGYKQEVVKDYFIHYDQINNDIIINTGYYKGQHSKSTAFPLKDNWEITMVNTGEHSLKSERLLAIEKYISSNTFMMTYGDGVGDIDIQALLNFHRSHGKIATVTGVAHPPRFGEITRNKDSVLTFNEKKNDGCIINGGFFVFQKEIFKRMTSAFDLEDSNLPLLAQEKQLMVYEHKGQWICMDTQKDMGDIQNLWKNEQARWRVD